MIDDSYVAMAATKLSDNNTCLVVFRVKPTVILLGLP